VALTLKSENVFSLPKDWIVVVTQVAEVFGVERRNRKTLPQQKFPIDYCILKVLVTRKRW
jgi:hypothetical protein